MNFREFLNEKKSTQEEQLKELAEYLELTEEELNENVIYGVAAWLSGSVMAGYMSTNPELIPYIIAAIILFVSETILEFSRWFTDNERMDRKVPSTWAILKRNFIRIKDNHLSKKTLENLSQSDIDNLIKDSNKAKSKLKGYAKSKITRAQNDLEKALKAGEPAKAVKIIKKLVEEITKSENNDI